ncbi:MAG: hypothetical protein VXZ72_02585 [Chlamydiota bacterium]|nr:hypothetical protein [Chlamydiota bacterium]
MTAREEKEAHVLNRQRAVYQRDLVKEAASAAALRRAARKLVFKNKSVRQRIPELMPHGGVDTKAHAQITERLRAELARKINTTGDDYLNHISKGRIKDLEDLIASGKRPVLGQEALTRQAKGKENMRAWIQDAKAQALNEGKPREWRKYLPRQEITALRIDRKKLINKRKQFDGAADRIKKIRESGEGMRADDIRAARDRLGSHLLGEGEGHFDPKKGKIIMEGFAEATPEVRAATALHEFNELAEARKYLRKGRNFEDVVTTDKVLGYGNIHANATLPVRDLNIARTATGKNADNLRETFENLRAGELHKMKEKMPTLRPMLKQLEGKGMVYGSRAPSKTVMRAQAILDSGKGSPQLKRRAQKIVSTYKAGQTPNVRLNRREINHVRDTYNSMFMK